MHLIKNLNYKKSSKIKHDVNFRNNFTKEIITADIVKEEEIGGKTFYVVKIGSRILKFSKEGYSILKN